jgi:hypothetical protein
VVRVEGDWSEVGRGRPEGVHREERQSQWNKYNISQMAISSLNNSKTIFV